MHSCRWCTPTAFESNFWVRSRGSQAICESLPPVSSSHS
jgi:hypothetical protein